MITGYNAESGEFSRDSWETDLTDTLFPEAGNVIFERLVDIGFIDSSGDIQLTGDSEDEYVFTLSFYDLPSAFVGSVSTADVIAVLTQNYTQKLLTLKSSDDDIVFNAQNDGRIGIGQIDDFDVNLTVSGSMDVVGEDYTYVEDVESLVYLYNTSETTDSTSDNFQEFTFFWEIMKLQHLLLLSTCQEIWG